ncbi:MAG: universal stress protein [Polyangia bacterium]
MTLNKILVATDFSPDSEPAIDTALELARGPENKITLLHVCEPPAYSTPSSLSMYVPSPELTENVITTARFALDERRARCAKKGVNVDVAWIVGSPAESIVGYAREHGFDLIVTGSHGRRGFRRLVLGSVAEAVVRTADRPVLTVHGPQGVTAAQGAA